MSIKLLFDHLDPSTRLRIINKLGIFNRLTAPSGVEGLKKNRNSKQVKFDRGAERHPYSMFDVWRSMFDVQSVRSRAFIS